MDIIVIFALAVAAGAVAIASFSSEKCESWIKEPEDQLSEE